MLPSALRGLVDAGTHGRCTSEGPGRTPRQPCP